MSLAQWHPFQTSDPQKCKGIHLCCFKPLIYCILQISTPGSLEGPLTRSNIGEKQLPDMPQCSVKFTIICHSTNRKLIVRQKCLDFTMNLVDLQEVSCPTTYLSKWHITLPFPKQAVRALLLISWWGRLLKSDITCVAQFHLSALCRHTVWLQGFTNLSGVPLGLLFYQL